MNDKWLRIFIIGLVMLAGGGELCAQRIPAWTRQLTCASWKNLTKDTCFKTNAKAPFIKFSRRNIATNLIKSTDRKFIYHHVNYSGVFSKAEKELLLKKNTPQATLGKMAYLHDKHAAFFSTLITRDPTAVSQSAFLKHQNTLEQLLSGLETHYRPNSQERFASATFSKEEIARLQAQAQPPAYLLSESELHYFAQLPTLVAQRQWVLGMIDFLQRTVTETLAKDTFQLKPAEFERYYVQNMRLEYFRSLAGVLEQATQKRASAIIRYRQPLPGSTVQLTDAQRAGYLQFMADTTSNPSFTQYIEHFNTQYGPYAVAEALGASYELALQRGMYFPELLGEEEGNYLRQLGFTSCLAELTPKIAQLDEQLAHLREHPSATPEFYASYYRVYAQQQIYKTLTARARAMIELENFRR